MWIGSITVVAVGSFSLAAVLNLVNPSIATTFIPSRHALGRGASYALNAALGWPSTMSSNLAGPVPARTASLAVFHDTANASAIRARVRCCTTSATSAHRNAAWDSFEAQPPGSCSDATRGHNRHTAVYGHQQRRRPPPERDMSQPPDDRVPRHSLDSHTDDTSRLDRPPDTPGLPDRVRPAAPRPPVPTRPGV